MTTTTAVPVTPRMNHPLMAIPHAFQRMTALAEATVQGSDLPVVTKYLVDLRASQINGCSFCVEMHAKELREAGESDERIFTVAAWREAPYFTAAERAALELTEVLTRLADHPDPVSDELWGRLNEHYSELELSALIVSIAVIQVWNRVNVAVRQPAGATG